MRTNAFKNGHLKSINKTNNKLVENGPKMSPMLVHKTSKKEQIRLPKWDPLKKRPKGGQMEPKRFQNDLKMEQK